MSRIRLPEPCLVVLVGASGAGKTTWATEQFGAWPVVSADSLRAVVGLHERDQRASKDAFAVLEQIVDARLGRGFTTVVDTTGLDAKRRARWIAIARKRDVAVHAVIVAVDERETRRRNKAREHPVPPDIVSSQLRSLPDAIAALDTEPFDAVHRAAAIDLVPRRYLTAPESARRQQEDPLTLEFGLQIGRFTWPGAPAETAARLGTIARAAEDAGFSSISVMDHFVQIPGVGREWEDMLESTATLGYLAAATSRARLGTLVTGVTYRNLAHVAKIVATLDVLSGGRAFCGLGAAWYGREHELYGWEFPPVGRRYELLEDALELLPLMWGQGSPRFEGRTVTVPEAICYPRPLQARVPIIVGGSGEKRTLRLVAQHADGCNLFGEPEVVRHKVEVLHAHCAAVGRDPSEVRVTHLSEASMLELVGERYADAVGTVEEQIGRYRELAEAGVQEAIVAVHVDGTPTQLEAFAPVIAAFR